MDMSLIHSLWTVLALAVFLGIVWWAYAPAHRERFERDGRLVFDEPDQPQENKGARR